MSDSVETRILEMQLDNDQFEKGIKTTIASLEELEDKLELKDAGNGFEKITAAANTIQFDAMERSLDTITDKFSLLGNIGLQALERISNKIVDIGENIIKGISITPITDGWREFEMKTNSTQTILGGIRNQYADEASAIRAIGTELDRLNNYADQTIYNFAQMTENVGKFTNQNIGLKTATAAIKGIGNWAAMVGADSAQMSRAMYNISQSLGGGAMKLVDWKSIRIANMATPEVQKLFANVARAKGALKDKKGNALKAGSKKEKEMFQSILKDFEGSLKSGWMTNDVMMTAFRILSNEMSEVDLMKLFGDTDEGKKLVAQYKEMGEYAAEAATKVKTFTQLVGVLQESLGSGWATTFEKLFGGFEKQTEFLTYLSKLIGGFLDKDAEERNAWVTEFVNGYGGMERLAGIVTQLVEIFLDLWSVIREVGQALANPFGGAHGGTFFSENNLNEIGLTAHSVANMLDTVGNALATLRNWFGRDNKDKNITTPYENVIKILRGVGSVVGIAVNALSSLWNFGMRIGKLFLPLFSSILNLFGGIGDVFYSVYANLLGQNTFTRFFNNLYDVLQPVISAVVGFASAIMNLITAFLGLDKGTGEFYSFTNRFGKPIRDFTNWFAALPTLITKTVTAISNFTNGVTKGFRAINKHVRKEGVMPFEDLVSIVYEFVEAGFGKETADTVQKWIDENIVGSLKGMIEWMTNSWRSVSNFFTTLPDKFNALITRLKEAFQAFGSYDYDNSLTGLENFKERLALLLTTLFGEDTGEKLLKFYTDNIEPAITTIAGMIESAFGEISRVFRGIVHVLQGEYDGTDNPFDLLQEIALNFLEGYDEGRTTPDVLKRRFSILELFKNLAETYETDIKPYLDQVQGWFTNELPEAIENIRRVLFGYDQENGQIFDPSLGPAPTEHIAGIFERIWDWAQTDGLTTVNNIVGFFTKTWDEIDRFLFGTEVVGKQGNTYRVGGLVNKASEIFNQIIDWFNGDGKALLDRVVAAIQDTWNRMYRFLFGYDRPALPGSKSGSLLKDGNDTHVDGVIDTVSGVFERILNWTDKDGNSIVNKITTFFSDSFEEINRFLFGPEIVGKQGNTYRAGGAFDEVVAFLDPIWKWISEKGEAVYNYLTTHNFEEMWAGLDEFLFGQKDLKDASGNTRVTEGALTPIINVLTPIAEFFKSIGTSVFEQIKNVDFAAIWDKIRIFFLGYEESTGQIFDPSLGPEPTKHVDGLFDRIANVFDRIVAFFESDAWTNLKSSISTFYHNVIEPIVGFMNGLGGTLFSEIGNWTEDGFFANVLRIFSGLLEYGSAELPGLIQNMLKEFGINLTEQTKDGKTGSDKPWWEELASAAAGFIIPSANADEAEEILDKAKDENEKASDNLQVKFGQVFGGSSSLMEFWEGNREKLSNLFGNLAGGLGEFLSLSTDSITGIIGAVFGLVALSNVTKITQSLTGRQSDSMIQDVADMFNAIGGLIGNLAWLIGVVAGANFLDKLGPSEAEDENKSVQEKLSSVDQLFKNITDLLSYIFRWMAGFGLGSYGVEILGDLISDYWGDKWKLNYASDTTSIADNIRSLGEGIRGVFEGINTMLEIIYKVLATEFILQFVNNDYFLKIDQETNSILGAAKESAGELEDTSSKTDKLIAAVDLVMNLVKRVVEKILGMEVLQGMLGLSYGLGSGFIAKMIYNATTSDGVSGIKTRMDSMSSLLMGVGSLIESITSSMSGLMTTIAFISVFSDFGKVQQNMSLIESMVGWFQRIMGSVALVSGAIGVKNLTNALRGFSAASGKLQITTGGTERVNAAWSNIKLLGKSLMWVGAFAGLIILIADLALIVAEKNIQRAASVVFHASAQISTALEAIGSISLPKSLNAAIAFNTVKEILDVLGSWGFAGKTEEETAESFALISYQLGRGFQALTSGLNGYTSTEVVDAVKSVNEVWDLFKRDGNDGLDVNDLQGKASIFQLAAENLKIASDAFAEITSDDVGNMQIVKLYVEAFRDVSAIMSSITGIGDFGTGLSFSYGFVPFLDFLEELSAAGKDTIRTGADGIDRLSTLDPEVIKAAFNTIIEALPDSPELMSKLRAFTEAGGGNLGLFTNGLYGLVSALEKYNEVMVKLGTENFTKQTAALSMINDLGQSMDTDYKFLKDNTDQNANTRLGLFAIDLLSLSESLQKIGEASIKADGTSYDFTGISKFFNDLYKIGYYAVDESGSWPTELASHFSEFVVQFGLMQSSFAAFVESIKDDGSFNPNFLDPISTFMDNLAKIEIELNTSGRTYFNAADLLFDTGSELSVITNVLPSLGSGIHSLYENSRDLFGEDLEFQAFGESGILKHVTTFVQDLANAADTMKGVSTGAYSLKNLTNDIYNTKGDGLFNMLPKMFNFIGSNDSINETGMARAREILGFLGLFITRLANLMSEERLSTSYTGISSPILELAGLFENDLYPAISNMDLTELQAYASAFGDLSNAMTLGGKTATLANAVNQVLEELKDQEIQIRVTPVWNWGDEVPEGLTVSPTPITGASVNNNYAQNAVQNILFPEVQTVHLTADDMGTLTQSISQSNNATKTAVDAAGNKLYGLRVQLDTGVLVGQLVDKINRRLGAQNRHNPFYPVMDNSSD